MTEVIFSIVIALILIGWLKESAASGFISKIASLGGFVSGIFGGLLIAHFLPDYGLISYVGGFFLIGSIVRFVLDSLASFFNFIKYIPVISSFSKLGGSLIGFIEFIFIYSFIVYTLESQGMSYFFSEFYVNSFTKQIINNLIL
jgi:hypothetical protein